MSRLLLLLAALCLPVRMTMADRVLLDFAQPVPPDRLSTVDARTGTVQVEGRARLRVNTGHAQPWPGVTLRAPAAAAWDLSSHAQLAVALHNSGPNRVTVFCRVDNPGADGVRNCVTGSVALEPNQSGRITVALRRTSEDRLGGKLFGLRGYPVRAGGEGTIDASNLTQLVIFVGKPSEDHQFDLETIAAGGAYTPPTAWVTDAEPYFPLIDRFGQYRHKDWPGKVKSVEDLAARRAAEDRELAGNPGPADWDEYGGWASGPKLEATGFFRTHQRDGNWWLVDPAGHLFWSHGIDCVRMLDTTPVEERETWFEDFAAIRTEFADFVRTAFALKGHYAGRSPVCFSFAGANLRRKYGPDWPQAYADTIHRRLRAWGLNTIANWSDERVKLLRRTPYTDAIGSHGARMIEGSEGYWGKFPDVYDPAFASSLARQMASKRDRSAGDPWCIGYFSDNEMSWGDEHSLALAALASPPDQPARVAFLEDLKARYGDIARLNAAWGSACDSWEALQRDNPRPDPQKAGDDLKAFYTRTAEQYFRTVRGAIKAVAPRQLYLGCRFAWVNARAAAAAAKYCDVVSYNLYQRDVAGFRFNGGRDVPLIIGEFHFGALDRGMFHTGLVPVADQAARAEAYAAYVRGALRHPQFVGCHWFQWQDEPTTGRVYDEENYQIGFVDIADTPYPETIAASRRVAETLYRERLEGSGGSGRR